MPSRNALTPVGVGVQGGPRSRRRGRRGRARPTAASRASGRTGPPRPCSRRTVRPAGPPRCGARPPSATCAPGRGRSPGRGTGRAGCRRDVGDAGCVARTVRALEARRQGARPAAGPGSVTAARTPANAAIRRPRGRPSAPQQPRRPSSRQPATASRGERAVVARRAGRPSAGRTVPSPRSSARPGSRPEHEVGDAHAEVRDHDATVGPRRARGQRLADHRRGSG